MSLEASTFKVVARSFDKEIVVPTSKSYANRILILAALNTQDVCIDHLPLSTDVLNMLKVFERIGLKVEREGVSTWIKSSFPACESSKKEEKIIVTTGDGGTTTRFLIPFLALGEKTYQIEPEGGMRDRPMDEMLEGLNKLGVETKFQTQGVWLEVKGPLNKHQNLTIDCKRSTQFASAFALACGSKNLAFRNLESSEAYLQMTLNCVEKAAQTHWVVPVDFSSLSYPLALAAVTGRVKVTNCFAPDPLQADSVLLEILAQSEVGIEWTDGLTVSRAGQLKAFTRSCSQCPDLVPTLAYLACFSEGESVLSGLEVLQYKESDRLTEISKILEAFGVEHSKTPSTLRIVGGTAQRASLKYHPPADHRMIMMTYLMMRTLSGGEVDQIHHVNKSFPDFFEVME